MKRHRNLSDSIGDYHDLNDSVNRLRDMGLIPPDLQCTLAWDSSKRNIKPCGSYVLMRTAWVSKELDRKGVPENVLDFCVYYGLCGIMLGYRGTPNPAEFISLLERYPMMSEAGDWLSRNMNWQP